MSGERWAAVSLAEERKQLLGLAYGGGMLVAAMAIQVTVTREVEV